MKFFYWRFSRKIEGEFWIFFRRPPTCPKFNTHKKVVVHFFIPMLLLPKTPPLTYPNMKRFKGPKKHHFTSLHFTSLTSLHFTSLTSLHSLKIQKVRGRHDGKAGSTEGLDVHSRAAGVYMASAFAASRLLAASPLAARFARALGLKSF